MKKLLIVVCLLALFIPASVYASSQWFDLGAGWKVRLDSPHIETKAWHVHFYYKSDHKWCIRLDNAQRCDTYNCKQQPPKWVLTGTYDIPQVEDKIRYYNQGNVNIIKRYIPAWALYSLAIILTFISIITFFIPADDAFTAAYWVWLLA